MFMLYNNQCSDKARGFTLVEMLVSIFVFIVVMLIATGAILSILDANRKTQTVQLVMNNVNFAMESMARTMRTGTKYHCNFNDTTPHPRTEPNDCLTPASSIVFEEANGSGTDPNDNWVYQLNTTTKQIELSENTGSTFTAITSPSVAVTDLAFYVLDSDDLDPPGVNRRQPRIIMVVRGTSGAQARTATTFNLQTVISQRLPDI